VTEEAAEAVERKGWRRVKTGKNDWKWEPVPEPPKAVVDPESKVPRPGDALDLSDIDDSLESSHERMRRTLALQSRRLEVNAAAPGGLFDYEIDQLGQLSNTWRTLTTHEPEPDLSGISTEEIQRRLDEKKRGKK